MRASARRTHPSSRRRRTRRQSRPSPPADPSARGRRGRADCRRRAHVDVGPVSALETETEVRGCDDAIDHLGGAALSAGGSASGQRSSAVGAAQRLTGGGWMNISTSSSDCSHSYTVRPGRAARALGTTKRSAGAPWNVTAFRATYFLGLSSSAASAGVTEALRFACVHQGRMWLSVGSLTLCCGLSGEPP